MSQQHIISQAKIMSHCQVCFLRHAKETVFLLSYFMASYGLLCSFIPQVVTCFERDKLGPLSV